MPYEDTDSPDELHSMTPSDEESDSSDSSQLSSKSSNWADDIDCPISGTSDETPIPSRSPKSYRTSIPKRSSALLAASRMRIFAQAEDMYTKRKSPSSKNTDDMPPPKVPKQSIADTVEVITVAIPAAKFLIGDLALVLTKQTSSVPTGIVVKVRSREYCETKKQWRYVGAAELFDDLDTSINVWEESLVKPKYQVGDVITRQLEGAVRIHGRVKRVWARGNIFEYEVEFEPVRFTDGALDH